MILESFMQNLNKTQATFRSAYPCMAKFLSLSTEAKLLIVSNSCNVNSNVFAIGSDSISKDTFFSIDNKKLLTLSNSNVSLFIQTTAHSDLLPAYSNSSLGRPDQRWGKIHLSGNQIHINNAILAYEETISEDNLITDYDISFIDKQTSNYIDIAAESFILKDADNYFAQLNGLVVTSYRPNGTMINSIDVSTIDTDMIQEGSNMFFTAARVISLAASLGIHSSNYERDTSNAAISFYKETSNNIIRYAFNTKPLLSTALTYTSNHVLSNLTVYDKRASNYLQNTSNVLATNASGTTYMNISNYVQKTSNYLASYLTIIMTTINFQIASNSNNIIIHDNITSNILSSNVMNMISAITTQLYVQDTAHSNIIKQNSSNLQGTQRTITSNILSEVDTIAINVSNILLPLNSNILQLEGDIKIQIQNLDNVSSNNITAYSDTVTSNVMSTSNVLKPWIQNINTTDMIRQGNKNKFIVNGTYPGDLTISNLTVIGNVTPGTDSVYDLGSSNYRWKDIYLSGNSIYLNNTVISSDQDTNGLIVKNSQGQLTEIIASAIKLQDQATGDIRLIQSINNKLNAEDGIGSNIKRVLTTDKVPEGTKLYFTTGRTGLIAAASNVAASNYTSQVYTDVEAHINSITCDMIHPGSSNQMIFNQTLNNNLTILGTLTACNLQVIGQEALIKTAIFTTDTMEIFTNTYTGTALIIIQGGPCNIAEFGSNVTINTAGWLGIGTVVPTEACHVVGNIKLTGTLNGITSNELVCLKGVASNIQTQIDNTHTFSSNYLQNISNLLSSNLRSTSNAIIHMLTTTASNQSNIISNISSWMNKLLTDTSNIITSNIISSYNSTSNITSNAFDIYLKQITISSNNLVSNIDTNLGTQSSNYVDICSNAVRISIQTMNTNISNLFTNIITTGWQVGANNVLYINSNVGIGTSVTNAALDINGDIRLSQGSTINGISTATMAYISDVTSPVQSQINMITLISSNFTSNMSNTLTNNATDLFDTLNSNITNADIQTSNYINTTSNILSSNLLSMVDTINSRINAINFSQWTVMQGSNIYFQNSVGIGTSMIGSGNKLEVYGGDVLIVGGTIKKSVDGRPVENYQIERWKDSTNYYTQTPKFITYTEGNVGIDLAGAPYSPLHVGDAIFTSNSTNMTYFTSNATAQLATINSLTNVCALFDSSILVKDTIASSSDERIKKNIAYINDDSALQKILAIEPKTYEYIDPLKGTTGVYGFIAQQIKEVIPEAVSLQKNVIPNIFCIAYSDMNVVTFDHYIQQYNLTCGTKISIIDLSGNQELYTICDINLDTKCIVIDGVIAGAKVFVYGTEVNDFCTLDKSYIFTLNVCATQILSSKIDNLEKRIAYIDYLTSNM
jgi:hypothetical protein